MNFTQMAESAAKAEEKDLRRAEDDPTALSYVQSFHMIRTLVGALGGALPFILIVGWWALNKRHLNLQGSLSAYYHTGVRDFFVGILVVIGILMVSYKIGTRKVDNYLTLAAGIAAIVAAIIPTAIDPKRQPTARLTAIQEWLGEDVAQTIHFLFAGFFVVLLSLICLYFARAELNPETEEFKGRSGKFPPRFWYHVHRSMAIIILFAAAYIVVTQVFGFWDTYSILVGEFAAIFAFGVSWFVKGLDFKVLRAEKPESGEQLLSGGDAMASVHT